MLSFFGPHIIPILLTMFYSFGFQVIYYGYLFLCAHLILQEDSFTEGSGQNDQLSPPNRSIFESSGSFEEFGSDNPLMSPSGMPSSSPDS